MHIKNITWNQMQLRSRNYVEELRRFEGMPLVTHYNYMIENTIKYNNQ